MRYLLLLLLVPTTSFAGVVKVTAREPCTVVNGVITKCFPTYNATGICVGHCPRGASIVLTAAHVIKTPTMEVKVHGYPATVVVRELIEKNDNYTDIAVLHVPGIRLTVHPLATSDAPIGTKVAFTGYAMGVYREGAGNIFKPGRVKGFVEVGQSGGPVGPADAIQGIISGRGDENDVQYTRASLIRPLVAQALAQCGGRASSGSQKVLPDKNVLNVPPPPGNLDTRMSDADKVRHIDELYRRLAKLETEQTELKTWLQKLQGDTRGAKGPTGDKGATGDKGSVGDRGPIGPAGPAGSRGTDGDPGAAGPTGDKGSPGDKGSTGDKGPQGEQGIAGPIGPRGPEGNSGGGSVQGPITFRIYGLDKDGVSEIIATTEWKGSGPIDIVLPPLQLRATVTDHKDTEDTSDDKVSTAQGKFRYGEVLPVGLHVNVKDK